MAKGTVQGRLNRETNPIPGEKPGYNPQYIDGDGYAVDVTPNTPYPVGSYGMTSGGVWIPRRVTDEGHVLTQLTGSNDEVVTLLAAEAVIDNEEHEIAIDVSKYYEWDIIIGNTLQDVEGQGVDVGISFSYGEGGYAKYFILEDMTPCAYRTMLQTPRAFHKIPAIHANVRISHFYLSQVPLTYVGTESKASTNSPFKDYLKTDAGNFRAMLIYRALSVPENGALTIWLIGKWGV